jgi:hypothetical protein
MEGVRENLRRAETDEAEEALGIHLAPYGN